MKLKFVLILVPLAQSSPLVGDLGKLFNSSETNAGLLGSLPVVGPLIDGVFGQFLRGIPIVGEILGGNQGQPHIPQQSDSWENIQYNQGDQGLEQQLQQLDDIINWGMQPQQSNYNSNWGMQPQQPDYNTNWSQQPQQPDCNYNLGQQQSGGNTWQQ